MENEDGPTGEEEEEEEEEVVVVVVGMVVVLLLPPVSRMVSYTVKMPNQTFPFSLSDTNPLLLLLLLQVMQTLGTVLPAIFLLLPILSSSPPTLTTAFLYLTAGTALSALTLAGVSVNHLDICPNYAGFVFGCGNTLATLAGLISVPISGLILDSTGSFANVFAVFALHYLLGAVVYWKWANDEDFSLDLSR